MSKVLNVLVFGKQGVTNEDLKESLSKRDWDVVSDITLESDLIEFTFEQRNEFTRLVMDALQKVLTPRTDDSGLLAKKYR